MGRPKGSKNKSTIAKENKINKTTAAKVKESQEPTTQESSTQGLITKGRPKTDSRPRCNLCNSPINSSPRVINISQLSGFAPYHFDIIPLIKVCDNCAVEFKDMIEKWLIKHGAEAKEYSSLAFKDKDKDKDKENNT